MTRSELIEGIRKKTSFLCIGLDTDIKKIPSQLLNTEDPVFEFNKAIIDATSDLCIAYKPNLAFYESLGPQGLNSLKKTVDYIPAGILKIADAKRGDIGNTSHMYAEAFFEYYNFDAVTINPYMGKDSIEPFLAFKGKWTIILALTSNPGCNDFEMDNLEEGGKLFEKIIKRSSSWAGPEQLMYVVGATMAHHLADIRKIIPDHFLLIPGIGAQGGSIEDVFIHGKNKDIGLLINVSRSIIYASDGIDFNIAAREESLKIVQQMKHFLGQ